MTLVPTPTAPSPTAPSPTVALFDLDGTLTWRDTLLPFLMGYVGRHPARALRTWRLPGAVAAFVAGGHDRGLLKSRAIRAVMGGDSRAAIDAWADLFVQDLLCAAFRPAALAVLEAHRRAGDRLVLLSASPDLYVPRIGRLLGFERTICTEVRWQGELLDGGLATPNRRGEEKSRCVAALRRAYPGAQITAYGNSESDLPHLMQADRALLVNAGAAARRRAAARGIPTADWA
jgi:phosphatidylglycerophosphatase C